jgi:flagellar basal-body rod protein FlgB
MAVNPFGDSTWKVAGAWLDGLSRRQQALSDNIANIDTPGYQAKSVPFEAELRRATGGAGVPLQATDPRHLRTAPGGGSSLGMQQVQQLTSSRLDQNNVDIDQEMVSLAETQMRYQAAASALNTRISILRNVIRGQ